MRKAYGLIGRTLTHSFSERYFRERFGEDKEVNYSLFELPEIEALPDFWRSHPALQGFNVTIPYKQQIIPYLDRLDPTAEAVGAVNCVKREGNQWIGYNTDVCGVEDSMHALLKGGGMADCALLLGTGGASQAVRYVLHRMGIGCKVVSRSLERGDYTYSDLTEEVVRRSKLIINATPVGTFPAVNEAPELPYHALTSDHFLFDLVYNPPLTAFLRQGHEQGARIMNGERMLRSQAEASWQIWGLI